MHIATLRMKNTNASRTCKSCLRLGYGRPARNKTRPFKETTQATSSLSVGDKAEFRVNPDFYLSQVITIPIQWTFEFVKTTKTVVQELF